MVSKWDITPRFRFYLLESFFALYTITMLVTIPEVTGAVTENCWHPVWIPCFAGSTSRGSGSSGIHKMQFAKMRSCRNVQYHAVKWYAWSTKCVIEFGVLPFTLFPVVLFFCGHSEFFSKGISCHHTSSQWRWGHWTVCRGLESYSSDFGCICNMGDARNNRAENDRRNNHLPEGWGYKPGPGCRYKMGL